MGRFPQLSAAEARAIADCAAERLASDPRVRLVYLFGSTTRAAHTAVRDVDLGVLADPPFSLDELTVRRADLVAATGGPIDLLSLNNASVVLAHEVAESGICLYAATPDDETAFVVRTRARYWDFKPYRDEQWRLAGARLEERRRGP